MLTQKVARRRGRGVCNVPQKGLIRPEERQCLSDWILWPSCISYECFSQIPFMHFVLKKFEKSIPLIACFCSCLNQWHLYLYSYYFTGTFWSLKHISSHSFGPRDLKFTTQLANCLRLLKKEKFFRSNPQSRLQAQKGVISEGLEALLLPLEHCLLNRSC